MCCVPSWTRMFDWRHRAKSLLARLFRVRDSPERLRAVRAWLVPGCVGFIVVHSLQTGSVLPGGSKARTRSGLSRGDFCRHVRHEWNAELHSLQRGTASPCLCPHASLPTFESRLQGDQCLGSDLLPRACSRGTWSSDQSAVCSACALPHATTLAEGSSSEADCCCDTGYYLVGANVTRECIRCQDEARCDEPGIELLTLPVEPGYWRVSGTSKSLLRCPTPDACEGGSICNTNSTSSATCDENPNNMCAKNHKGPLCQVCLEGHYKPTRAGMCISCDGGNSTASYAAAGGLLLFVLLAAVFMLLYIRRRRRRRQVAANTKEKEQQIVSVKPQRTIRKVIWRRLGSESLMNKCKLVISLFQVVGSFDLIFDSANHSRTRPPCCHSDEISWNLGDSPVPSILPLDACVGVDL